MLVVVFVPLAWLLGTFPSAQLVARAHGRDILKEGSGNPGASNVARLLGWRAGALVLLSTSRRARSRRARAWRSVAAPGAFALGVAAVVGHTFPIYRKGGKGVATARRRARRVVPVDRRRARGRVVRRRAAAAQGVARVVARTILFPVAVAVLGYDAWEIAVVAALAVLVIVRHLGNIRRLLRRQEIDLGAPSELTSAPRIDAALKERGCSQCAKR